MTDPLAELKRAFDSANPKPDPVRRAANLARAQAMFERAQGIVVAPRPTRDRPFGWAGLRQGGSRMFAAFATRPALATTAALAALGLVVLVPVIREGTIPFVQQDALLSVEEEMYEEEMNEEEMSLESVLANESSAEPRAVRSRAQSLEDLFAGGSPVGYESLSEAGSETFANADPQPLRITAEEPVSTPMPISA